MGKEIALNTKDLEGYYWMADSEKPTIVKLGDTLNVGEKVEDFPKDENYVVAAFFCRYKDGKPYSSIHVRFVDGEYVGDEVKIPDENVNFQSFLGDQGLPKLNFVQLWDSEVITYDNESFETLVPGKSLFAGFVKNNK